MLTYGDLQSFNPTFWPLYSTFYSGFLEDFYQCVQVGDKILGARQLSGKLPAGFLKSGMDFTHSLNSHKSRHPTAKILPNRFRA